MKNITISIDDTVYRNARIRAAEQSTSVSALVRDYLIELVNGKKPDQKFNRLLENQNRLIASIHKKHPGLKSSENLTRERLYRNHDLS